jgi:hypothetical protein
MYDSAIGSKNPEAGIKKLEYLANIPLIGSRDQRDWRKVT